MLNSEKGIKATLSRPSNTNNPKNVLVITIQYSHGDADAETTDTIIPQNLYEAVVCEILCSTSYTAYDQKGYKQSDILDTFKRMVIGYEDWMNWNKILELFIFMYNTRAKSWDRIDYIDDYSEIPALDCTCDGCHFADMDTSDTVYYDESGQPCEIGLEVSVMDMVKEYMEYMGYNDEPKELLKDICSGKEKLELPEVQDE